MTVTDLRLYDIVRTAKEQRNTLNDQLARLLEDAAVIPIEWGPATAAKMAQIVDLYDELIAQNADRP